MRIVTALNLLFLGLCSGGPLLQGISTVNYVKKGKVTSDAPETRDDLVDCFNPEMKSTFPDIDFAFLGYNIMRGYPLTSGRDPGFTHRVKQN